MSFIRSAWSDFLSPLLKRPPLLQMAALCYRVTDKGVEVLLVTSSENNWILPKGWPIPGRSGAATAMQEAWEEAGVQGVVHSSPYAETVSVKRFDTGAEVPCQVEVYAIEVSALCAEFPERDRRQRKWVTPEEAARQLSCVNMQAVLEGFDASTL